MFCPSVLASALLLAAALRAHAHAGVTPALGVPGTFAPSNVQRPAAAAECGSTNVAKTLDASTPVVAAADGTFTATVTNFNAGADGSRSVAVKVDPSGAGTAFVAGTVQTNGDATPTNVGSQKIVAALPAGTKCTGGTAQNLCLASFTTTSGFGNCVVVQQGAAAAAAAPPNAHAPAVDTPNTAASAAGTPAPKTHDCKKGARAAAVDVASNPNKKKKTAKDAAASGADGKKDTVSNPNKKKKTANDGGAEGKKDTASNPNKKKTTAKDAGPSGADGKKKKDSATNSNKKKKTAKDAAASRADGKKKKPSHKKDAQAAAAGTRAPRAARAAEAAMES